jgi:hypothetical protein
MSAISRLLQILSGMGVEVIVRDGDLEHRFMDPIKIFDRDAMTDEKRIAKIRQSQPFEEMLKRQGEIVEHWRRSPGEAIRDYPHQLRINTIAFQEMLIEDQRKLGRIIEVDAYSGEERWLEVESFRLGPPAPARPPPGDSPSQTRPARLGKQASR